MPRPLAVADILTAAFHGKPAGKRLEEGKIWLVWDAAVGRQVAATARPVSFRDGILTVAVSSAPWMQQLTFLKRNMVDKLNEQLGRPLIRDIYLKAGPPTPLSRQAEPAESAERRLTERETRLIAAQTAAISDPELREAFVRVLSRALATQPERDS